MANTELFPVGTKVRIIGKNESEHGYSIGEIVTVTMLDATRGFMKCKSSNELFQWIYPPECELADEPKETIASIPIEAEAPLNQSIITIRITAGMTRTIFTNISDKGALLALQDVVEQIKAITNEQ